MQTRDVQVGSALVIGGMVAQEAGTSLAILVFPLVGAVGAVAMRLNLSAILVIALVRPRLRGRTRTDWSNVLGYGVVLAAMNSSFYLALERIPLGAAVTVEVLGPLALSVIDGRRWSSLIWAAVAFAGVALLGGSPGVLNLAGVAFALIAAACWACYIVASKRVGARFSGLDGLALALVIGGMLTVPAAVVIDGTALFSPTALLLGVGLAVLSSALPYALELLALRRLSASTFAILLALAPAVAAMAGLAILRQTLPLNSWAGIALVVVASVGAVRGAARTQAVGNVVNSDAAIMVSRDDDRVPACPS